MSSRCAAVSRGGPSAVRNHISFRIRSASEGCRTLDMHPNKPVRDGYPGLRFWIAIVNCDPTLRFRPLDNQSYRALALSLPLNGYMSVVCPGRQSFPALTDSFWGAADALCSHRDLPQVTLSRLDFGPPILAQRENQPVKRETSCSKPRKSALLEKGRGLW